jgi:hypothetical protein
MINVAHSILAQVPWLKVFLAWALAVAVVLLVLAIPGYYLFLPLTQRLRTAVSRYLALARERHAQKRTRRDETERDLLARYAQDHLLRHVDATSNRLWARTKASLLQPARDIQARLTVITHRMEEFTKALPQLHERLQGIADAIPKDFHLTTSDINLTQATGTLRVARLALICSSLLIVAIITVNTGMLSQIVRDLGFIPASFKFLSIPLYYILALLITCVEAGLGIVHGVLADADLSDERMKIHIGPILAAIGAVGVACVEGFFYSRIMPSRVETVTLPLIGYTLPQTDIFFIWGFLLVMTLFGLGLIFYRMSARVLRGTALTTLRKQLRGFTKETVRWSGALQQTETWAATARASVGTSEGTTTPAPFAADAVERLLVELRTLTNTPPRWITIAEQPLGAPEVVHLARHAMLWLCLSIAATVLAIYTGIASFTMLVPAAINPIVLALGEAALVATAGFLTGWGETVVQGNDWQKVTSPNWGRVIGLALLCVFTLSFLLLTIRMHAIGIVLWIGNLLICFVVSAACYQLTPLLGLMEIWTQRVVHMLASTREFAYRSLIVAFLVVAVLLDQLMAIFASPLVALKGRRVSAPDIATTYANEPR